MKKFILNQSPFVSSLLLLLPIALLMLAPTEVWFNSRLKSDFSAEYINLGLKMGLIFLLGYFLIKKMNFESLAGLSSAQSWSFKYLNLLPAYLFVLGLLAVVSKDWTQINPLNLLLLLISCLLVGFAEEFVFRGFLQTLFLNRYGRTGKGIIISISLSSLLFGLFHLLNLSTNENTGQVFVQVVYATFMGFFFGALLLKTNKLIPIAITHGLINFFFLFAFLPGIKEEEALSVEAVSIAPILVFLPLFISAILLMRKINK